MENIREEETEPLAASPPRRMAEAYSHNDRRSKMKRCAYYIFFFTSMVCFVLMHLSANSVDQKQQMRAQKVRKKAEIMPEDAVQKIQSAIKHVELDEKIAIINDAHAAYDESTDNNDSSSGSVDSDALVNDIMKDGDELDREVKSVLADVDKAEQGEIDTNYSMITSAVKNLEDSIMYYLGNVFGGGGEYEEFDDDDDMVASTPSSDVTLTEKQLDVIAKKISERLELDAKKEFKAKADAVKNEKKVEIEQILEDDTQAKMALRDITKAVKEASPVVVEDLRDEIDEAAEQVKDSLPEKAKQIRDIVVEEVTGKSLNTIEKSKRAKAEKRKQLRKNFEEIVKSKTKSGMNDHEKIDTVFPNPNLVTSSSTPEEDVDASDTNTKEDESDRAKRDNSDDSSDDKKSVDVDGGKEMTPSEKRAKEKKDKIDMVTAKEKEETDEEEEEENKEDEEEEVHTAKEETDEEEEDKSKEDEEEDRGNLALAATTTLAKVVQEQTDMHPGIKGKSAVKTNSAYSDIEMEDEDENEETEINQHGEEEDDDDEEAVE